MPHMKDQILAEAMTLDSREREELAEELLLSVDEILDPDWAAEIERRLAAYKSGQAKTSSADEMFQKLEKTLGR